MKAIFIFTILIFPKLTLALCHYQAPICEKIQVEDIIQVPDKYPSGTKLRKKGHCILKYRFGDKKHLTRESWANQIDCSVVKKGFEAYAIYFQGCGDVGRWPPCESALCKYEDLVGSIRISPMDYKNGDEQVKKDVPSECKHILKF
jgi:hypothetical protein